MRVACISHGSIVPLNRRPFDRVSALSMGYGAHLDEGVALSRAVCEAVQSRLTMISGSRDDLFHRAYDELGDLDNLARAWRDWPARGEGVGREAPARRDQPAEREHAESHTEPVLHGTS